MKRDQNRILNVFEQGLALVTRLNFRSRTFSWFGTSTIAVPFCTHVHFVPQQRCMHRNVLLNRFFAHAVDIEGARKKGRLGFFLLCLPPRNLSTKIKRGFFSLEKKDQDRLGTFLHSPFSTRCVSHSIFVPRSLPTPIWEKAANFFSTRVRMKMAREICIPNRETDRRLFRIFRNSRKRRVGNKNGRGKSNNSIILKGCCHRSFRS